MLFLILSVFTWNYPVALSTKVFIIEYFLISDPQFAYMCALVKLIYSSVGFVYSYWYGSYPSILICNLVR